MAPSLQSSAPTVVKRDGLYPFDESAWDRFWSRVEVRGVDECWEWQGSRNVAGYGQFIVDGKNVRAHRMMAAAKAGRPLNGPDEYACHHCDNPPCVNPKHLFLGTATDNMRDMLRKGRNGLGGKTRIERIRAALGRQAKRAGVGELWFRSRIAVAESYDFDLFDADINDVLVACDAVPVAVEPEPAPDLDDVLDLDRLNRALDRAIEDLQPKWRAVIELRRQGRTLHECGVELDLTRERCRQIEEAAIAKLRRHPRIVEMLRGRPAPAPTKDLERRRARERAREINASMAAFFERRRAAALAEKPAPARRGRPPSRYRRPREGGRLTRVCSFCSQPGHMVSGCMERWRAERRAEGRAA